MGSSKKKKQAKHKDFQKVKLKVGKKLPKGLNVTDTSYKSKKIVIPNQLSNSRTDPAAHYELSLEELLKRLDHHNHSTRSEALRHIKEKLQINNEMLTTRLSEILGKVLNCIADTDFKVREAALCVMQCILERSTESRIEPFTPLIISHLCCGMNDIELKTREDALKLLDLILDIQPNNICHSDKILNSFLDQISTFSIRGNSNKEQRSARMLCVNPNESIETHVWRVHVLRRLLKFLQAIIKGLTKQSDIDEEEMNMVKYEKKPLYIPIYLYEGLKPSDPFMDDRRIENDFSQDINIIKVFVTEMMPLIFDAWTEETSHVAGSVHGARKIEALCVMMQIVCCFGEWIQLIDKDGKLVGWFKDEYNSYFSSLFMKSFPYSENSAKWKKIKGKIIPERGSLKLNLLLCMLYSTFVTNTPFEKKEQLDNTGKFTIKVISADSSDGANNMPEILKVVRSFLENKSEYDMEDTSDNYTENASDNDAENSFDNDMENISNNDMENDIEKMAECQIRCLQKLCQTMHPGHENRHLLSAFFSELALDFKYQHFLQSEGLSCWLGNLIEEMKIMEESKVIDKKLLISIQKISSRQYEAFMKSLDLQSDDLLVLLTSTEQILQDTVADLITKIEVISSAFLKKLADTFLNPAVSLRNVRYIVQHLTSRMVWEKEETLPPEEYVKFLFNLVPGMKVAEVGMWSENNDIAEFSKHWKIISPFLKFDVVPSVKWERHSKVLEHVIESLLLIQNYQDISTCADNFLYYYLNRVTEFGKPPMPIHCALGLLTLRDKVANYKYKCVDTELLNLLTELTLSVIMYGIAFTSTEEGQEMKEKRGVTPAKNVIPTREVALQVLDLLNLKVVDFTDLTLESSYYIGSAILILIDLKYIQRENLNSLLPCLTAMKNHLGEEKISEQLWWTKIFLFYKPTQLPPK